MMITWEEKVDKKVSISASKAHSKDISISSKDLGMSLANGDIHDSKTFLLEKVYFSR